MKHSKIKDNRIFRCYTEQYFPQHILGMFRIGEVTEGTHAIRAKDVHIGKNKEKLMFILHTSKTHGLDSKPQIVKISSSKSLLELENKKGKNSTSVLQLNSDNQFCPFSLLRQYVALRRSRRCTSEQFFIFRDRTPVTPNHVRPVLKQTLKQLGLNNKLYGFHSLRGGRATDLLEMSVSVETIKSLGRWKSSAVFKYLKT